jgi:hypothetical protein
VIRRLADCRALVLPLPGQTGRRDVGATARGKSDDERMMRWRKFAVRDHLAVSGCGPGLRGALDAAVTRVEGADSRQLATGRRRREFKRSVWGVRHVIAAIARTSRHYSSLGDLRSKTRPIAG